MVLFEAYFMFVGSRSAIVVSGSALDQLDVAVQVGHIETAGVLTAVWERCPTPKKVTHNPSLADLPPRHRTVRVQPLHTGCRQLTWNEDARVAPMLFILIARASGTIFVLLKAPIHIGNVAEFPVLRCIYHRISIPFRYIICAARELLQESGPGAVENLHKAIIFVRTKLFQQTRMGVAMGLVASLP